MISGDKIAALVSLSMALTLVLANLRGWRMPISRTLTLALIWLLIIASVTLFFAQFRGHLPD